jgi:hypothetical protein
MMMLVAYQVLKRIFVRIVELNVEHTGPKPALRRELDVETASKIQRLRDEEAARIAAAASAAAAAAAAAEEAAISAAFAANAGKMKESDNSRSKGFAQSVDGTLSQTASGTSHCSVAGSVPLSSSTPSFWSVEISAYNSWCLIGVTLKSDPPAATHSDSGTYAWSATNQTYVAGSDRTSQLQSGWSSGFAYGDVATFKFDPSQRSLSMYHSRHKKVFTITGIAAGPVHVLVDLYNNTNRIRLRAATADEKKLLA